MRVVNIHKKRISQQKEKWPPMIFKKGLKEGAVGGHGPIKYSVQKYIPRNLI